jgi:peptide/nickel transport system substrate-binding protein
MNKESLRALSKKEWHLPYGDKMMRIIRSFSLTEKVIFLFFTIILIVSSLSLLWQLNQRFLVEVPDYGGQLTEGVIGSPRFVNPLLAISDTDRDLSSLIYSGLLKVMPDGTLIPDLAKSYKISSDGLVYTFVLKDNIYFHDGTKVTADDVVFTVEKAQDANIKSPRKTNWDGVKVDKIDDNTVTFTLKQPYSPFIQNTTLGILPKHIWKTASAEEFPFSQYNTKPIGSGPYKVDSITYTGSGLPSEYHLQSFNKYTLGKPFITYLVIKSFQNEKDIISAYKSGSIESMHSISPNQLDTLKLQKNEIITAPLPRIFGVFFNQNVAPVFVNKEVRQALNMATNREEIIQSVLAGFGQTIEEPMPPKDASQTNTNNFNQENIDSAIVLLTKNGWKKNASGIMEKKNKKETVTLSFSISTSDAPELKAIAEILQKQWQKIGAQVEIKIFEVGDLNQNIIRPRKYDSLLFGEIIGRDMDLYPFWHSSQRVDPGLNIALYTNLKADKILESIRKTTSPASQQTLYKNFNNEIDVDVPAVFIYSPSFIYIVPPKVKNIKIGQLTTPSERFSDINTWYIETSKVWEIFAK